MEICTCYPAGSVYVPGVLIVQQGMFISEQASTKSQMMHLDLFQNTMTISLMRGRCIDVILSECRDVLAAHPLSWEIPSQMPCMGSQ